METLASETLVDEERKGRGMGTRREEKDPIVSPPAPGLFRNLSSNRLGRVWLDGWRLPVRFPLHHKVLCGKQEIFY